MDWLSDITPAIHAQTLWKTGDYEITDLVHIRAVEAGPFAIACGASLLAEHIRRFRFSPEVIMRLGQMRTISGENIFAESFLNFLQRMRLSVTAFGAADGTVLVKGEPVMAVQGAKIQLAILESAFRKLIWEPSYIATHAAMKRWENADWPENETPAAPFFSWTESGWRARALYIGGVNEKDTSFSIVTVPSNWNTPVNDPATGLPLTQIRRLFLGERPLADAWMTEQSELSASVSRPDLSIFDQKTGLNTPIHMNRYQLLYHPVLFNGKPVMTEVDPALSRQRTLKHLESFSGIGFDPYPAGWYSAEPL